MKEAAGEDFESENYYLLKFIGIDKLGNGLYGPEVSQLQVSDMIANNSNSEI